MGSTDTAIAEPACIIGAMASAWINAILLAAILLRRGFLTADARLRRILPRLLLSCAGMGLATWGAVTWVWPGSFASTLEQAIALGIHDHGHETDLRGDLHRWHQEGASIGDDTVCDCLDAGVGIQVHERAVGARYMHIALNQGT